MIYECAQNIIKNIAHSSAIADSVVASVAGVAFCVLLAQHFSHLIVQHIENCTMLFDNICNLCLPVQPSYLYHFDIS
jgi:hypothetical protein